jgi:hypothetical protein
MTNSGRDRWSHPRKGSVHFVKRVLIVRRLGDCSCSIGELVRSGAHAGASAGAATGTGTGVDVSVSDVNASKESFLSKCKNCAACEFVCNLSAGYG